MLAHCLQLQAVGQAPRNLSCADPTHLGLPLFLTGSEVLSVYRKGFTILSTDGQTLWSRGVPGGHPIGEHRRSLNGNRFAILIIGRTVFDQVNVPAKHWAILVYDRVKRAQVFHLISGEDNARIDFEFSPDGSMLAVLVDDVIRLYKTPEWLRIEGIRRQNGCPETSLLCASKMRLKREPQFGEVEISRLEFRDKSAEPNRRS